MHRRGVCGVVLMIVLSGYAVADDVPTYSRDVAGIIYEKCTACHREGGSGPFALQSYEDVKRRASTIEAVIADGYMPPWKPVDRGISFAHDRSLSAEQQRVLEDWIDNDCPIGDHRAIPTPPVYPEGWVLGTPDLVVKMNGVFEVPADGPDIYRSFVFPVDLPRDQWIKAIELRPQAKGAVHHAIFFVDPKKNARQLDGVDGKAGMEGMGFLSGIGSDSRPAPFWRRRREGAGESAPAGDVVSPTGLGGYVPGAMPNRLPGDLAMYLPRGSDIVMQTHFHPSGKVETEQAELAVYFADRPPSRRIIPIMVPPVFGFGKQLKIPAGESNYVVEDSYRIPVATKAVGVSGHAHYICKTVKMTAKLPSGETRVLLDIDDWDLDWQDQYQFANPIALPRGTELTSRITYDNSAGNPENPYHPPREISWGRGSNDEMCSVTLMTVAEKATQQLELQQSVRKYYARSLLNGDSAQLAARIMQLDNDRDGLLQLSEAPPRMRDRAFVWIDRNNDKGLDQKELERALRWTDWTPRPSR